MSLQVWLPLNGNLNNQGLGNITTISGSPTYKNGKVTSKSLNLKQRIYFTCPQLANLQTFSVCFWGMTEDSSTLTTNWQDLIGFTDVSSSGTNGTFRWETCYGSTMTNYIGIHWHDNATNALVNGSAVHSKERSKWYHCCVVFDLINQKLYSYTNGNLIATHTHSGGRFNTEGKFYLGETNNIEGCIQDVRFYDHALSPKEVKEISKGLVLHYRLAGHGSENLILESHKVTGGGCASGIIRSIESDGTLKVISTSGNGNWCSLGFSKNSNSNVGSNLSIGDLYTISVDVKVESGTVLPTLFINAGNGYKQLKGTIVLGQWIRAYYSSTWASPGTSYGNISLHLGFSSAIGTYYFKNFKLERGNIPTPWCPSPTDSLYSALGYSNNIEYDCSGYSNNGIKSDTITYDSNTPRYTTSYKFTGSQYIAAGRSAMVTDTITVSWWGYMDNWANYTRAISCTEGGGWNFEPNSGKMAFPIYRNGQYISVIDTAALSSYPSGWHYFAATYDGYKSRIYVDGILKATSTETTTKYPIVYNATNGIFIGAEAAGSVSTPTSTKFNGKLSDIRIYATALSAEDIAELYHTAAVIDNQNNMYAYEYVEEEAHA